MAIHLPDLPFSPADLEPHISAETIGFHYSKHHKSYVDKTNGAIEGGSLASASLEEIITAADARDDRALFNAAAQTWNHQFYWESLAPTQGNVPSSALQAAIDKSFGGLDDLKSKLGAAAKGHFASGWVWLVEQGGSLAVLETHDAGCPLTMDAKPLLTIDVWEHAYYLDQQNERPKYVEAVIDNLLNWQFASANFESDSVWKFPQS